MQCTVFSLFGHFFGTSNVQATAAYDGLIGPRD
jgi:hypothetical protein